MKLNLEKKNVLLTGASRGIGRAIAEYLLSAGAKLAVHYNKNKAKAKEVLGKTNNNGSEIFQSNLESPEEARKLFLDVKEKFGSIDILINNAGIFLNSPVDLHPNEWLKNWDKTMSVNLTSLAVLCKEAILHFLEIGGGRIINIASRAAFRGDTEEYLAYAASKGGIVSLTRSIARAYGKKKIKAFVVAPGFVRTDMADQFFKLYGEEKALNEVALPELTEPDDVAPLVVFLASGLADHATGGTFDINAASYVH